MSEADVIALTTTPATSATLTDDLLTLGVKPGSTLIVHSAMSKIGFVCGAAPAVILALEAALGPTGTLVMPAHSGDLSDPAEWGNPPVPESWHPILRDHIPAFQPDLTPSRGMGTIAETFRKQNGVLRSNHPQDSFCARGPQAELITANHLLESGLGEQSPLARLYDLDAWVLLLGVGHGNNTSLHLAEHRAQYPSKKRVRRGTAIMVDGQRQWVWFEDLDWDTEDFEAVGTAFEQETGAAIIGRIGQAEARLFSQRRLVDFSAAWMSSHRN